MMNLHKIFSNLAFYKKTNTQFKVDIINFKHFLISILFLIVVFVIFTFFSEKHEKLTKMVPKIASKSMWNGSKLGSGHWKLGFKWGAID